MLGGVCANARTAQLLYYRFWTRNPYSTRPPDWPVKCQYFMLMCLAVPGKVLEATDIGNSRIAKVQFGDITRQVYLDFVPEVQAGDYVLVHVGFAISRVEAEEAERTYELLRQLQEEMPEQEPQ